MTSRHLVDPQLLPLLDALPDVAMSAETLSARRARPRVFQPDPLDVGITDLQVRMIPGPKGAPEVEVLVYRPSGSPDLLPCILHFHGGGYVAGDAQGLEAGHRRLVADLRCALVSVNYRLAPETVFPGALEDGYAALSWIVGRAGELGVDTTRLGVMGESAGGGLAAGLTLLARDRGEHRLAFQHLLYPSLDDRTSTMSEPHPFTGEFLVTPAVHRFAWTSLLGFEPGGEGVSPYAAPARAEDLTSLPPAYIATGSLDLGLEAHLEYARRLTRAGVPTELHVYRGAFHGFPLAHKSDVARAAARDARAALARALAPS